MKRTWKQIGSLILSVCMVMTMLPTTAFAETGTKDSGAGLGTSGEITAFAALDADIAAQTVETGTAEEELNLPTELTVTVTRTVTVTTGSSITATVSGNDTATDSEAQEPEAQEETQKIKEEATVPVSGWTSAPAYDGDTDGTYVFSPALELQSGITLADSITAPTITVTVEETAIPTLRSAIAPLSSGTDIDINEANFPDANFLMWLKSQSYGSDAVLTAEEITGITSMNVSGKSIASLTGIEYFTALTTLNCSSNQLSTLDVSGLSALEYLNCGSNQLSTLDVSGLSALETLYCDSNQLSSLDVSGLSALTILYCGSNQLSTLDVSGLTSLTTLYCNPNQLSSLDVSGLTALTSLDCDSNQLSSLDVSGLTALTELYCGSNQLSSLDVSGLTALTLLDCNSNQLSSLDVSTLTNLTTLWCSYNYMLAESAVTGLNKSITTNFYFEPQNTDTTAPILTSGMVSRTSNTEATIGFTTDEDGTAFYSVVDKGANAPTKEAVVLAGASLGSVSGTVTGKSITLTAGAKDIYVAVRDAVGNISEPLKIEAAAYVPGGSITGTMDIGGTTVADLRVDAGNIDANGWSWNATAALLILKANYQGAPIAINCGSNDSIKLIYLENVVISSTSTSAIYCNGNLEITGTGGTLTVDSQSTVSLSSAIEVRNTLTVSGDAQIDATSAISGTSAFYEAVIVGMYGVTITDAASITTNATGNDVSGIYAEEGNVTISTSGTVTAGGNGIGGGLAIMSGRKLNMSSGSLVLHGRPFLGNEFSDYAITGGSITIAGTQVYKALLTLDGVSTTTSVTNVTAANIPVIGVITGSGTSAEGKLCVLLPAGSHTVTLTAGSSTYTGTVNVTSNHQATATLTKASAPQPLPLPGIPTLAWNQDDSFTLSWPAVPNATKYQVRIYKDGSQLYEDFITANELPDGEFQDAGSYTFSVAAIGDGVNYSNSPHSPQSVVYVYPRVTGTAPTITTTTLQDTIVGDSMYVAALSASGTAPITWTLESGTLPPGLNLSSGGGIDGGATTEGTYIFTLKAANASGSDTKTYTIRVYPASTSLYTVTFDLNGGTRTGGGELTQTIASGGSATAPTVSRSGYTFTGWDKAFTNVTSTLTVTANWSYNGGGGNGGGSGGGSSSGGSSGSTTTTTTPGKTPDQPVTATTPVTATAGTNGAASAAIPEKSITDAIAKAQADAKAQGKTANGTTVALNVTMPKGATSLTANLTRNSLNSLVSAGVSSLELNGSPVTVSFDTKALAEIQKQSTGNISIIIAPNTKLSASAKTMIGTRPVYDLTVNYTKDGKNATVSSFGGGIATVSVPYTPAKGEAIGGLYAVYVDAKGNATRIAGSAYDANSGCVIFTTTHFSLYGIGYTAPSAKFTDITTHWAKESIDYVVGRGLLSGTSDTTFAPDTAMTRGMLVTALGRLANVDTKAYTTNSFTDVKSDSAFRPYIEWAYSKGIVQGTGNSKFEPDRAITREEIAVIFANFAKATGYTLPVTRTATTYADASSIGSTYKTAVTAMQQAGIMMGGTNNKFNPQSSATRAEVSSMLHRYIKLTIDPSTAQGWAKNDAGQYLYYKDGKALTGTQTIDGVKYFFETTGVLKTGWVQDGNNWRFYSGNIMLVGFWDLGANGSNKTYYFDTYGNMVSGKWLQIDGKWYYFNADGSLAKSTKIDGYEVDEKGVRKTK